MMAELKLDVDGGALDTSSKAVNNNGGDFVIKYLLKKPVKNGI